MHNIKSIESNPILSFKRPLRSHFESQADGIVYMVNGNEDHLMDDARIDLNRYTEDERLKELPILIVVCKENLDDSSRHGAVPQAEDLGLNDATKLPWSELVSLTHFTYSLVLLCTKALPETMLTYCQLGH